MKKNNNGLTTVALVITIIILLAISCIAYNLVVGENGVLTQANENEVSFNKGEVLEEINVMVTEKYLDAYSKATKDGENKIESFYNGEKVIEFLKGHSGGETGNDYLTVDTTVVIEELKGFSSPTEQRYFILLDSLNMKIERYGKGENSVDSKDYFYIKVSDNSYKVCYVNPNGDDEEVGNIEIDQSLPS